MDSQNVPYTGEDLNVPPVSLESEAWLLSQLASVTPRTIYTVGASVEAARTILGCNVRIPKGTPGIVTAVRTGDNLKTEYVVDWKDLSYPSFEDSPDGQDPGAALAFLLKFITQPETVHHTSLYAVPEKAVRPAGRPSPVAS